MRALNNILLFFLFTILSSFVHAMNTSNVSIIVHHIDMSDHAPEYGLIFNLDLVPERRLRKKYEKRMLQAGEKIDNIKKQWEKNTQGCQVVAERLQSESLSNNAKKYEQ
jgi:hypothetical protein